MIYYLATAGYGHTMRTFLEHWGPKLAGSVRIVGYDEAFHAKELPLGTYVFSDLERLTSTERQVAEIVWNQLHGAGALLLNHPTKTLRRYELLVRLHQLGRNVFRAVRAADRRAETFHFPVFVRENRDHGGSLTRLLHNRREVNEALAGAMFRGHRLENLLIVEYCDTADADGVYRKYAAFRVGDRVIPAHIDASRQWMVKDTDIVVADVLENERRYLETNPHRAWIEEIFALAGVEYGRIDYSLIGDQPQVWEINTNPIIVLNPSNYTEAHMPIKRVLAGMMVPALAEIDSAATGVVTIDVPAAMNAQAGIERRREERARSRVHTFRRIQGLAAFRALRKIVHPLLSPLSPLLTRSRDKAKAR